MVFWLCESCSPTFAAVISALDRTTAMEKKTECVDSLIRDVALLQNEVVLLRKSNFPSLNAVKTGFHRNRSNSPSVSLRILGSKKRKAEKFVLKATQRKLRPSTEVKTGTNTSSSIFSGVKKPDRR